MIKRIINRYNESGLAGVLISVVRTVPGIDAFCPFYIYGMPIRPTGRETGPKISLNYRVIDNSSALFEWDMFGDRLQLYEQRLTAGHLCLLAHTRALAVGYLWIDPGQCHSEQRFGFHLPIGQSQLYYYDSFVAVEFRRKGVLSGLLHAIHTMINTSNRSEIIAMIDVDNRISQYAHAAAGMARKSFWVHAVIGGRRFLREVTVHR